MANDNQDQGLPGRDQRITHCCDSPYLQWDYTDPFNLSLMCQCGSEWVPITEEIIYQSLANQCYQVAWQTLLSRIDQKSSWGKNLLKDLMLDCFTNPQTRSRSGNRNIKTNAVSLREPKDEEKKE